MKDYEIKDDILEILYKRRSFYHPKKIYEFLRIKDEISILRAHLLEMEEIGHVESEIPFFAKEFGKKLPPSQLEDYRIFKISDAGVKFYKESNYKEVHFKNQKIIVLAEKEKKRNRIRDDWRFWLSVFAIAIALASLLMDLLQK